MVRLTLTSISIGEHGVACDVLRLIADSGAEKHILCGTDFPRAQNRRPLAQPIVLETANGETL
eukprot:9477540-Pyramimonas_sp.AAC.1